MAFGAKFIIYQCLDGAVVTGNDGSQESTLQKARSQYSNALFVPEDTPLAPASTFDGPQKSTLQKARSKYSNALFVPEDIPLMDGAVATGNAFGGPQELTLEEARSKYSNATVVKLEDMTVEMLKKFMESPDNFEVLESISPNCPKQDIPYNND